MSSDYDILDQPTDTESSKSTSNSDSNSSSSTIIKSSLISKVPRIQSGTNNTITMSQNDSSTTAFIVPRANNPSLNNAALQNLTKLSNSTQILWKDELYGLLDSCGLGYFLRKTVIQPTEPSKANLYYMLRAQAMQAVRASLEISDKSHISGIYDPYEAMIKLEACHGGSLGIATATVITEIVTKKYYQPQSLNKYIDLMEGLHKSLSALTAKNDNLKLSDQLLSIFILINLPVATFSSIIQQLLKNVETLTPNVVFQRLLHEEQLRKVTSSTIVGGNSVAFSTQSVNQHTNQTRKHTTDQRSNVNVSRAPNDKCFIHTRGFNQHTNIQCRTQHPELALTHTSQYSRPMNRSKSAPGAQANVTSSSNIKASNGVSNDEKIRAYDLFMANKSPVVANNVNTEDPGEDNQDSTIYFSNVYSAMMRKMADGSRHVDELIVDSGADQHIFNNIKLFKDIHTIDRITICTADGSCEMHASQAGSVVVKSFDISGKEHHIELNNALYYPAIAVNLISAVKICDSGCKVFGDASHLSFINHGNNSRLEASRLQDSDTLWTVKTHHQHIVARVAFKLNHIVNRSNPHLLSPILLDHCTEYTAM